jgi:hypothetical protein
LKWSKLRNALLEDGIELVMVSIGVPEKLATLIDHLEIENGHEYLFVDPENALYDALDLNRGIERTFFNVNTPYAFLDRFTRKDGIKELGEVLSKWNKGKTCICYRPGQHFL